MMTDFLCFLLPFTPTDFVFIIHHFLTGAYMLDCVHLQRAGASVMPWLWLGEVTGPLLNMFSMARQLREEHKVSLHTDMPILYSRVCTRTCRQQRRCFKR